MSAARPWDLGVDLDGVLYDFAGQVARHAESALGLAPGALPGARRWEFYLDWGWDAGRFSRFVAEGINDGAIFSAGEPLPGAREGWAALRDAGHRLHVVTNRLHPGAERAARAGTLGWLRDAGFDPDSVSFRADKAFIRTVAKDPGRVAFLDDMAENYQALEAAGVRAALLSQPWNEHLADAVRVQSVGEFADVVARWERAGLHRAPM